MKERVGKRPDQLFAVVCYGAAVAISTVLSVVLSVAVSKEGNLYLYLAFLLPQVGYIGVFCYMYFVRNKNKMSDFLPKEKVKGVDYPLAVTAAVGLLFFSWLPNLHLQQLIASWGSSASVIVPKLNSWDDYVLCAIILCVLPAIGEELVFRKSFCDGMEGVADYKTVLLCGLAFALSHFNLAQTVHQFFLGCVLGFVYVLTKNVTLTMVMHLVNNAIAVFLERITGSEIWHNTTVNAVACAIGAVVLAASLVLIWRKKRKLDNTKTGKIEYIMIGLFIVLALIWAVAVAVSFR